MQAIFSGIGGAVIGMLVFVASYYDSLLKQAQGKLGWIASYQLNQMENFYLFGGAILGVLIYIAIKVKK